MAIVDCEELGGVEIVGKFNWILNREFTVYAPKFSVFIVMKKYM